MKINNKTLYFSSIFLLLIISCSIISPVNNLKRKIIKMNIVSYELQWLINTGNPNPQQKYVIILQGTDRNIIKSIKKSLSDITLYSNDPTTTIHQAAQGILILHDNEGIKKQIDISEIGFFVGNKRTCNSLFFSAGLSKVIEALALNSDYKDKLIITDNFFESLSKNKLK